MKNKFTLTVLVLTVIWNSKIIGQTFEPLPGPSGVTVTGMAVTADGKIFISVPFEGIYRSTDKGETWKSFMIGIPGENPTATDLVAAPNGEIYSIVDNIFYRLPVGEDEWVSKFLSGLSYLSRISANSEGNIFVCLADLTVMRAESSTESFGFHAKLPGFNYFSKMVSYGGELNFGLHAYSRELVWFNGIWPPYSLDVTPEGFEIGENVRDLHRLPNGNLLMASTHRLWISSDDADSWTSVDIDPNEDSEYIYAAHLTQDNQYFILTTDDTYISEDGGNSFEKLSGFPNNYSSKTIMTSFENHFYIASEGNFFMHSSDKGLTWERLDTKLNFPKIFRIYESPFKELFVLTGKIEGTEKSDDWGQNWETVTINNGSINSIAVHPNGDYFAAVESPDWGLFRSTDEGQTWTDITPATVYGQTQNISVTPECTLLSSDREYLLRSEDLGQTWESLQGEHHWLFPPNYHPSGDIYLNSYGNVQRSSDDGKNWVTLVDKVMPLHPPAICGNGDVIFSVALTDIIGFPVFETFHLINNGNTPLNIQMPFWESYDTKSECDCDGNIFTATSKEIFKSFDGGQNWISVSLGNNDLNRLDFLFFDSKNHLYIGRHLDTPLRSVDPICEFTDVVFEPEGNAVKVNISPNPISDIALIQIETEVEKEYTLRLFNAVGKEIRTEKFNSNTHQIEKGNLNSGIYFYQLETENQVFDSGKLIIK